MAHYYVACRSRIGRTQEPYRGREEFFQQCLRGVLDQTRRGVDWDAFRSRDDAMDWLEQHPPSANPDDDIIKPDAMALPYFYQLVVSLALLLTVAVGFRTLQYIYDRHCVCHEWSCVIYIPWTLFMPHCQAYQHWLVEINTWVIYAFWAFVSSLSVYIYSPLYGKIKRWTVFGASEMPNMPE